MINKIINIFYITLLFLLFNTYNTSDSSSKLKGEYLSQYQESQSAEFQIKLVSCLNLILTSLKGPDGNMHLHKAIRKTKLDRGKFYDKYIISLTTQCINNIAQGQLEYLLIP